MGEMVETTWSSEPDTLGYEWFISPDGKICHTCERYKDSAAVMTHMKNVGAEVRPETLRGCGAEEAGRLRRCGRRGESTFASLNPIYLETAAGFTR